MAADANQLQDLCQLLQAGDEDSARRLIENPSSVTAQWECAVSPQNRIKSSLRIGLGSFTLQDLSESQLRVCQFRNLMQHLLLISGLTGTEMQGNDSGDHSFTDTDVLFSDSETLIIEKNAVYLLC